jgi:hypothetical protein
VSKQSSFTRVVSIHKGVTHGSQEESQESRKEGRQEGDQEEEVVVVVSFE